MKKRKSKKVLVQLYMEQVTALKALCRHNKYASQNEIIRQAIDLAAEKL